MNPAQPTRRRSIGTGLDVAPGQRAHAGSRAAAAPLSQAGPAPEPRAAGSDTVSIVRIRNGRIDLAVEEAIDLLGGIETVSRGKERIMLKPNLVADSPDCTTKPQVVETLARLMQRAGKEVLIGEGSAAAGGFNAKDGVIYRTRTRELLDGMQQQVFDALGYTELARSLRVPLVNLHSGDLVDVPLPGGHVFDHLTLHRSLTEVDLLCSVPMMKTHVLATVTLAMKNVIGLYPGTVYSSVRSWLHDRAAEAGCPGIAYEIVDMLRANRMGLSVVDASTAMEGDGPSGGPLVDMGLIIAGTTPLATDLVAADLMGIAAGEVPAFACAQQAGMGPADLQEIEVRGLNPEQARRPFVKPKVIAWTSINQSWGVQEL